MSKVGPFILQGICFKAQGDVGPLTCYTNKRGIVMFLKAWLSDPASPAQVNHRNRIRNCASSWQIQQKATKVRWEKLSKACGSHLNGYNLWVCCSMNPRARDALPTLIRQTGIVVDLPPEQ